MPKQPGTITPHDRGFVALTFDFDGPSIWLMRKMASPVPVSRGEFGAVAVPRILRILERRCIPATFFIPGHTIDTYPDVCQMIVDAGCEVGLHGYVHEANTGLGHDQERAIIERCTELIDQLTGQPPYGYRAPAGTMTEQTIEILTDMGLLYDSSLLGHDYRPYQLRIGDQYNYDSAIEWGQASGLVEMPWSWTLDDYPYLEFVSQRNSLLPGLARPDDMFANFGDDIEWMTRNVTNGLTNVIFHPQVIGRGHRLLAMERWLDRVSDFGVKFCQLAEAAKAFNAGLPFGVEPI